MGIDFETAEEGAALLSTAIAELTEHAHEEAVVMRRGDLRIMVVRAETLKAAGADMITLAAATPARPTSGPSLAKAGPRCRPPTTTAGSAAGPWTDQG